MKRIIGGILGYIKKTFAMIIGYIFYDPKYLRGKYFDKRRYSMGWRWIMETVFMQKIVGINRKIPFPVSFRATVIGWQNIEFDRDNITLFQKAGNYYQAGDAKIIFGKDCFVACNVGIITSNHDPNDLSKHLPGKDIVIGAHSWIGMNSMILPGVILGEHTVVGAGSVVTKSFPEGNCVIAGNPAKVIKQLEPQKTGSGEKMKIIESESKCTGCALCADICPKGAITMQAKPDGFKYPVIDGEACIHCNLCRKKCPVLQPKKKIEPLEAFALRDKCEGDRLKSASGGAATLFMKKTLENGGICSGVVLNKEFEAVHELCESESALDAFRDSKYIQSDTNGIYKKLEAALREKPLVLVVGLPCQIAAVRSRFGERDNLVLCDLICHGAPSPLILKKNIELLEQERGCKVTGFLFRDKTNGWQKSNVKVSFDDGSAAVYERKDSEFFRLFGQNLILRPSCGNCTFKDFNMSSDITLGDYWGIEKRFPELNDDKGCSLVMVNTPRGKAFFDGIKDCADCVDTGVDFAVETHPKLIKSVKRNPYSASFFKALNKNASPAHFKKTVDIFCSQDIINKVIKKFISR